MKKATFIAVVATVVVMLTGCGEQQKAEQHSSGVIIEQHNTINEQEKTINAKQDDIDELTTKNENLANENAELKEKLAELEANANKNPDAKDDEIDSLTSENENLKKRVEDLEAAAKKQETTQNSTTSTTVKNDEAVKVPLIPKDQENIRVSALYHGKEIPLYVATEENRADSINNAKSIAVQDARGNDIRDRDISFIINGVSVTNVYVVDDGFKEVEDLSYDGVDNTYLAQYYMPGAGQYTFLIRTSNGTHYYATVVY